MPDSGAVYQPTTVGYTYDSGGDGVGTAGGLRSGFWRIMSRHKISSRKWLEWMLFSVAVSFFIAGLTTMLVSLVSVDDIQPENQIEVNGKGQSTAQSTNVEERVDEAAKNSVTLGAGMMLVGLLMGFVWVWLRFFHRSKSTRNGITGSSGQMLGGLNPSTDLLVGSTSQYGPVLTELPSQMKLQKTSGEAPAAPLSDQEEETRTLIHDSTIPPAESVRPSTIAIQIPG